MRVNMKKIGIKLADGSFFPVLEEGNVEKKQINLTTVKDEQTTVKVDLFRSEDMSMNNAEYVDTLKISHLKKHPKGAPDIGLDIWLDEDNHLGAALHDPESGAEAHTSVTLMSTILSGDTNPGTGKGLLGAAEEVNAAKPEEDKAKEIAASLDDFKFDLPDFNDAPDENGIILKDNTTVSEATVAEPVSEDLPAIEETVTEDIPVIEEPAAEDFTVTEDTIAEDAATSKDPLEESLPVIDAGPVDENFDLPDFDMPDFDNDKTASEAAAVIDSDKASENTEENKTDISDFDMPDFDNDTESQNTQTAALLNDTFNFSDLDDDTSDSDTKEDTSKKTRLPVIICLVCAAICIIAVILLLFIIPSRFNLITSKNTGNKGIEVVEQTLPAKEEPPTPVKEEDIKPAAPAAKEDEIVVVTEAETVVPDIQPEPEEPKKIREITYKIKWGDTLWDLSDAYYKNPWRYPRIAKYNGIKNPDHIVAGTYIKIPED